MSKQTATLKDLVEVLNDGIEFFAHAAERSSDPRHIELFQHVRHLKETIAADLKAELAMGGDEPGSDGSWLGGFRQGYADLRARLTNDPEQQYIAALEQQEDRVLKAFRSAVETDQPARVRELAATYLPEVQQMHDTLKSLKQQHANH